MWHWCQRHIKAKHIGVILYKFTTANSDLLCVLTLSYYLSQADIWLFHLQALHQCFGGSSVLDADRAALYHKQQPGMSIRYDIRIPIDHHQSNFPIISNTSCGWTSCQVWYGLFWSLFGFFLSYECWSWWAWIWMWPWLLLQNMFTHIKNANCTNA